jgi:hypothetical protein
MIDTNQIQQAAQVAQAAASAATTIKEQISPWMISAISLGAAWAGREISRATAAAKNGAEWLMGHGGLLKIGVKVFWN